MKNPLAPNKAVQYYLDTNGSFVIENYNHSKAFSNFFPGIAGVWGIPMWVFYVNRGQCISSFGIEGKDKAMVEFQPANKAYRLTSLQGFRTFIKIKSGKKIHFWEPFQNNVLLSSYKTEQKMVITSHDLTIEDVNLTLGIKISINYFTLADEAYPALVRQVVVENISRKKYDIEILDGLPMIMPYGLRDWCIKNMSRTVEAWVKVRNLKQKVPFFNLNVEVADTPDVQHITEGNFYFSFVPSPRKSKLLQIIVEGICVFGNSSDFRMPECFLEQKSFKVPSVQQTSNRTPCAMSFARFALQAGQKKEIVSFVGHAHSQNQLKSIVKQATAKGFVDKKAQINKEIISSIKSYAFTNSSSEEFNQYCTQTFLDNVMRGGLPVSLKTQEGDVAFNVFSRKHGDLERDYNYFVLSPTYFSQGNGNYRDVNQNRRNDVWFNNDVKDSAIINFLSLSQADGYNPLVVKGTSFCVKDLKKLNAVVRACVKGNAQIIKILLKDGFQPGELLAAVSKNGVSLKVSQGKFLSRVLGVCQKTEVADHGEGFWSDHWTYNLDLIESFLCVYPEERKSILLDKKVFTFYHNSHYVLPRSERYVLTSKGVRQYHSVENGAEEINADEKGNKLRTRSGEGDVYYTNLFVKLLCLVVNKAATFDPSGIGIEMEADKPNWYDALNGLPGLLGSSLSETLELKRLCLFLLKIIGKLGLKKGERISVFEELSDFILDISKVLIEEQHALSYWKRANDIKEHYRTRIRHGIAGEEHDMRIGDIKSFLQNVISRTNIAVERAKDRRGLIATYFYHEVTAYKVLDKEHATCTYVMPKKFKCHNLPLFLEGFVHALRVKEDEGEARNLFHRLRRSELFDKKLKMYKVNANLSNQTEEIGRTRIFPSGWLENGSIWLHMEYKYLLELLRCGLYEEFYMSLKNTLVPFLKPEIYGRSILENSSFIVSSAHEDKELHGQGFVARLSGSTAEFLHMWLFMNMGKNPFVCDRHKDLCLRFRPILPGWMFTEEKTVAELYDRDGNCRKVNLPKNTYAFNFMGSTLVVYHNPSRKDTFSKINIKEIALMYANRQHPVIIPGDTIAAGYARDVRNNKVERIDVWFE